MREQHVLDHGEAARNVQLRGRQVREQQVPDHGEAALDVQLRRRQVWEQPVPDHGEAALKVQLWRHQVLAPQAPRDEGAAAKGGFGAGGTSWRGPGLGWSCCDGAHEHAGPSAGRRYQHDVESRGQGGGEGGAVTGGVAAVAVRHGE